MTSTTQQDVSIVVPTYKRPDGLKVALESLLAMDMTGFDVEIIVADNDPQGSAKDMVRSISETASVDIIYVHVPEPGVSNARNGAMAHVKGRFVAFLDDDMEASEAWLRELVRVSQLYKAAIVFGPALAVMPSPHRPEYDFMHDLFSRTMQAREGVTDRTFGMGGCMLDLSLCQLPSPVFDPAMNKSGGEDDVLYEHLIAHGARVAWAPEALSYEIVPRSRATLTYVWDRNFAFGQSPSQSASDRGVSGLFGVVKWMCVGALQTVAYAPLMLVYSVIKRPSRVKYLARTARGLGKILWWDGFTPALYGGGKKAA